MRVLITPSKAEEFMSLFRVLDGVHFSPRYAIQIYHVDERVLDGDMLPSGSNCIFQTINLAMKNGI